MEHLTKKLDLDTHIGDVALSNGQSLFIPKLSMSKIIKIVKFLGIDGARLYNEVREILLKEDMEDLEKFAIVLDTLEEEQLIMVFSILLDLPPKAVLQFDPNEFLEILLVYVEKTDLKKTFFLIRRLMKQMFNKEIPETPGAWLASLRKAPAAAQPATNGAK